MQGAARLWLDGGGECDLAPGDHLLIEAGRRHRVTWTSPDEPTIWLAVHITR
jgi:cupin 2 domain-containing protein